MDELPNKLKRKTRNSSGSEADRKTMTETIVQQLQQVLERLTSVEGNLDGVFEKAQRLETALSGVKSDVTELQSKITQMRKASDDMDAGLNNLNMEVQELRKRIGENEKEIQLTNVCTMKSTKGGRICDFWASPKLWAPKKLHVKLSISFWRGS